MDRDRRISVRKLLKQIDGLLDRLPTSDSMDLEDRLGSIKYEALGLLCEQGADIPASLSCHPDDPNCRPGDTGDPD